MPPSDDDPFSIEQLDTDLVNSARTMALAINSYDPEPLIDQLAEQIKFESQSSLEVLSGKEEVSEFLRDKLKTVEEGGLPPQAEVGIIGNDEVGVIISQENIIRTFWAIRLNEEDKIKSILAITVAPHPGSAIGFGEMPGLDIERFQREEDDRINRHREWVESLNGPIKFVGFAIFDEMKRELENCLQDLVERFPGATYTVTVHDLGSQDDAVRNQASQDASKFDFKGYPAIGVIKDGQVIKNGGGSNTVKGVMADLEQMGEKPNGQISLFD